MHAHHDWIGLERMTVNCRIGCSAAERSAEQPVAIELGFSLDLDAAMGGDLGRSVNYAEILEQVTFIAREGRFVLLESLAAAVARHLLAPPARGEPRAEIRAARIKVSKPEIFGGRAVPSIEVARDQAWYAAQTRAENVSSAAIDLLHANAERRTCHVTLEPRCEHALMAPASVYVVAGRLSCDSAMLGPGEQRSGVCNLAARGELPARALVAVRTSPSS